MPEQLATKFSPAAELWKQSVLFDLRRVLVRMIEAYGQAEAQTVLLETLEGLGHGAD